MPPRPRVGLLDQLILPYSTKPSPSLSTSSICTRCVPRAEISCSSSFTKAASALPPRRNFSSTSNRNGMSVARRDMMAWLQGPGATLKHGETSSLDALDGQTGAPYYLRSQLVDEEAELDELLEDLDKLPENDEETDSDLVNAGSRGLEDIHAAENQRPFPQNPYFISQPVLSEEHKDAIWQLVKEEGRSVREVSVMFGVEMNRVAAVLRLKGVEKEWTSKNKPLANAYSRAIMRLLPVTEFKPGETHEPINDLPTHRATKNQIFFPVAESRTLTRTEAGKVFEKGLLAPEERLPHPQLVQMYRDRAQAGVPGSEVEDEQAVQSRLQEFYDTEKKERQRVAEWRALKVTENTNLVETRRSTFRISNVKVDEQTVGIDGRGHKGVGARYGVPHGDRKKGAVKIPTSVGAGY